MYKNRVNTLGAAPSYGPIGLGMLGGSNFVVSGSSAFTSTTGISTLSTIPIPSSGFWLITGCLGSNSGAAVVTFTVSGNTTLDLRSANSVYQGGYANISTIMLTNSATSIYIIAAQTTAVVTINPIWVSITRVA